MKFFRILKHYMKKIFLLIALVFTVANSFAQDDTIIKGTVMNDANDNVLENVNIVNLNQVKGTTTMKKVSLQLRLR